MVETRDLDAMMELCSEDVVYQDAGPSSEMGREEMRRLWTPIFAAMEHAQATVLNSFVGIDGDTVAAHWRYTFKHRDVVEPLEIETVAIYGFRDGLVSRWTSIFRNFDWMGDVWP